MAAARYDRYATLTSSGATIPSATVTIEFPGGGVADIFSDSGLTTPIANPTTADANGRVQFWIEESEYDITVESGALSTTYPNVAIYPKPEDKQSTIVFTDDLANIDSIEPTNDEFAILSHKFDHTAIGGPLESSGTVTTVQMPTGESGRAYQEIQYNTFDSSDIYPNFAPQLFLIWRRWGSSDTTWQDWYPVAGKLSQTYDYEFPITYTPSNINWYNCLRGTEVLIGNTGDTLYLTTSIIDTVPSNVSASRALGGRIVNYGNTALTVQGAVSSGSDPIYVLGESSLKDLINQSVSIAVGGFISWYVDVNNNVIINSSNSVNATFTDR